MYIPFFVLMSNCYFVNVIIVIIEKKKKKKKEVTNKTDNRTVSYKNRTGRTLVQIK